MNNADPKPVLSFRPDQTVYLLINMFPACICQNKAVDLMDPLFPFAMFAS